MANFIVKVTQGQSKTAGTKAKSDVVHFLNQIGFQTINYHVVNNKYVRVLLGLRQWHHSLQKVKENDVVVYQYPAYSRFLGDRFIKAIKAKRAHAYILLHDVNSLRMYHDSPTDQTRELNFINQFDGVIAHNAHMQKWLQEHGIKKRIVPLQIFDYAATYPMNQKSLTKSAAYTGNLEKSIFLKQLKLKTPIRLYGILPQQPYPTNITYQGSFTADELGNQVTEGFGLVWDGQSVDTCDGVLGNYLRYNNPHKTSFYLSKGLPVIIWDQAALADFISDNQCGILLSSLNDLDIKLANLTEEELTKLKENALQIGEKLRQGYFLKKAVRRLLNEP